MRLRGRRAARRPSDVHQVPQPTLSGSFGAFFFFDAFPSMKSIRSTKFTALLISTFRGKSEANWITPEEELQFQIYHVLVISRDWPRYSIITPLKVLSFKSVVILHEGGVAPSCARFSRFCLASAIVFRYRSISRRWTLHSRRAFRPWACRNRVSDSRTLAWVTVVDHLNVCFI